MNCTSCGSADSRNFLHCSAGEILKCRSCGLVFLSQEGRADQVEDLYTREYFTEREKYFFQDGVVDGGGDEAEHVGDFRAGLEFIEEHASGRGTLLDVGCATGSFLRLAKATGWDCDGVEISSFAAATASETEGVEVFCGRFNDAPYDEATFDAITMWDLLEHLPEPLEALTRARRFLKPQGLILVNAPNENSLIRMTSRLLYRGSGGLIRTPVNRLYHGYHYSYFSPKTLSRLFREAGFEVVALRTKSIPISRGRISPAAKLVIQALSVAERLAHAEYELLLLGRKKGLSGDSRSTE